MPRLPISVILQAYRHDPLLPRLLKECRSLDSARNELRWLREKVISDLIASGCGQTCGPNGLMKWEKQLMNMCYQRAKGKPLQYILGDQPFGDLEILCRKGVLIPRIETELCTVYATNLILDDIRHDYSHSDSKCQAESLRILDLCTGSGCISLLLHALLAPYIEDLTIMGIDISSRAIKLAQKNLKHNLRLGLLSTRAKNDVRFRQADILGFQDYGNPGLELPSYPFSRHVNERESSLSRSNLNWDVLISNPPYISPSCLRDGTTARSVRIYEPTSALVPPSITHWHLSKFNIGHVKQEDTFYPVLLSLAFGLQTKLAIFECGNLAQAQRVATIAELLERKVDHDSKFAVSIWHPGVRDRNDLGGAQAVVLRKLK